MLEQDWLIEVSRRFSEARDYDEFYGALGESLQECAPGAGYSVLLVGPDGAAGQIDRSTVSGPALIPLPPQLGAVVLEGPDAGVAGWFELDGLEVPAGFAVRMTYQDEPYGLFLVHPMPGDDLDASRLSVLGRLVGSRYVTVQLHQEESRQARTASERLAWINRLGEELSGGLQTEEMIPKIVGVVLELVGAQVATLVLKRGDRFESMTEFGIPLSVVTDLYLAGGTTLLADHVLETGESFLVHDPATDDRIDFSRITSHRIENLLAVPLVTKERRLGVLLLVNSPSNPPFPAEERAALPTLAGVASQALENSILYNDAVKLKIAQKIQESLLPDDPPPRAGVELAGWSQACDETGGDYYDFVEVDENRIGIVIGDVSGHGLGAALFMLTARALLRSFLTTVDGIDQVFYRTNNMLEADMASEQFMTCFLGILDAKERQLLYTSAGHDAPFLYRPSIDDFADLDSTGFPLGIMSDSDFPMAEPVPLEVGDVLVFGTDGIWEAMNPGDQEYGRDRLCALVRRVAHLPCSGIIGAIRTDVLEFCAGRAQRDDWTICVVKVVEDPPCIDREAT